MDTQKSLVIKKVKRYLRELIKHKIRVDKAYLYGSYSRGNYHKDSDIDIIIISDDFQGIGIYDYKKIIPYRRNIDVKIEPIAYKTEDFNDSDPLAVEVMATGEEIKL